MTKYPESNANENYAKVLQDSLIALRIQQNDDLAE